MEPPVVTHEMASHPRGSSSVLRNSGEIMADQCWHPSRQASTFRDFNEPVKKTEQRELDFIGVGAILNL